MSLRPRGALIGLLAGALVGALLALNLGSSASTAATFRAAVLAPLLGSFGLLLDLLLVWRPAWWQPRYPGRLVWSRPFKLVLYWTAVYPLVRLLQDLLATTLLGGGTSTGLDLPHLRGVQPLLAFLLFQALFGTAFGIGFAILYRATGGR